jgi:hypothetical protein
MSREGQIAERSTGTDGGQQPAQNTSVAEALDKVHQRLLNRPAAPASFADLRQR